MAESVHVEHQRGEKERVFNRHRDLNYGWKRERKHNYYRITKRWSRFLFLSQFLQKKNNVVQFRVDCKKLCQIGVADHRNSSAQRYVEEILERRENLRK